MTTWNALFNAPHIGSVRSTQSSTEADPSAATEGLPLEGTEAIIVFLSAADGETLNGTGALAGFRYEPIHAAWSYAPLGSLGVPEDVAGKQRACIGVIEVQGRRGRFTMACKGVGVSSGSITVDLVAVRVDGSLR
jgi:hypothetical protein